MVTKEQLLSSSAQSKYMLKKSGRQLKCVLTFNEMKQRLAEGANTVQVFNSVFQQYDIFFYTDNYCMGVNIPEFTSKHLVPSSTVIPHPVKAREGLEDGWVDSLEDYEFIYCKNKRRIETVEELLEYLNS